MKNKNGIPLLCTSLVFFLAYFIMIARMPDPVLNIIVPIVAEGLSFCGAVFVVTSIKPVSDRWYRGIPHTAAIGIVCIAMTGRLFTLPHNTDYFTLSLALLSLTSIGFFMAFPEPQRRTTRLYALFSGVIGLYAIFLIYQIVTALTRPLQTSWNVIGAYSAIYLIVLLPLIGICHIGSALGWKDKEGRPV